MTSALARGGCERQILATADGLLRRGNQIEIFYFATGEVEFTEEFSRLGIKCRHAFEAAESITRGYDREDVHGLVKFVRLVDRLDVLAIGSALDRAIKEFRPEIVHRWFDLANVIEGLVSTDLGVPRVVLGQRNLPVFRSIDGIEPYACRDAYRLLIRNLNVVVLNNSLAGLCGLCEMAGRPRFRGHPNFGVFASFSMAVCYEVGECDPAGSVKQLLTEHHLIEH